jgi:hypothetical protein
MLHHPFSIIKRLILLLIVYLLLYGHTYTHDIRLYEYGHEQVKIKKKRWNDKEIKKFYWK